MTAPISVAGLTCRLGGREVLHGIDLEIADGEVVGVLGPNGCGKTTLLRCIAGLRPFEGGSVRIEGREVRAVPPARLARRLALQAQDGEAALGFTVRDVVAMGRLPHRPAMFAGASRTDHEIVEACLARLELSDLAARPVETLSGGERQRVMIARALAQDPAILLLDEPTNHLDIRHQFDVLRHVAGLGITVVMTLHDLQLAASLCGRIVVLKAGRVVADGAPRQALAAATIADVWEVDAVVETEPASGRMRIDLAPRAGPRPSC